MRDGMDNHLSDTIASGVLKWFDRKAGFGFLKSVEFTDDVLIHYSALRDYGLSDLASDTSVSFTYTRTKRGLSVKKLISVEEPDPLDMQIDPDPELSVLLPGRLKWFDPKLGFGFVRCFGDIADVFLSKATLERSSVADLKTGDALCVQTVMGPRGLSAAAVYPWEAALVQE